MIYLTIALLVVALVQALLLYVLNMNMGTISRNQVQIARLPICGHVWVSQSGSQHVCGEMSMHHGRMHLCEDSHCNARLGYGAVHSAEVVECSHG